MHSMSVDHTVVVATSVASLVLGISSLPLNVSSSPPSTSDSQEGELEEKDEDELSESLE